MAALLEMGLESSDVYWDALAKCARDRENLGLRRGMNRQTGEAVLYQFRPFQTLKNLIGKNPAGGVPV